jgi:hypothetical protein
MKLSETATPAKSPRLWPVQVEPDPVRSRCTEKHDRASPDQMIMLTPICPCLAPRSEVPDPCDTGS